MKLKILAIALASVMAIASCVYAGQETSETVQETADTVQETADTAQETADTAQDTADTAQDTAAPTVSGYYIANYAQTADKVNLNIINESDLLASAQQAHTTIYNFKENGTVEIYNEDGFSEAGYEAKDGVLTLSAEDLSEEYEYEFVDAQLIIRNEDEASMLYAFTLEDAQHITIDDYSVIEIDAKSVEVTEETIDSYINTVLQGQTVYDTVTEGTVQSGDIITISFEGVLEGEEEPFEGGSSEGITFQLGSGALIEGFEEQLTGKEIGSTFDVNITFPEDYEGNSELIGKNAVFSTTVTDKRVANTPELTDEWVQEFSGKVLPEKLESVDEFREYSREYLEEYLLHTAMMNALAAKTTITGYNSAVTQMLVNYTASILNMEAQYSGTDAKTYASALGFESPESYEQAQTLSYMNIAMITNKVLVDQGIMYSSQELDEGLEGYLRLSASQYSLQEYKENASAADMWVYTNLEYKYTRAMEALEDRVVIK